MSAYKRKANCLPFFVLLGTFSCIALISSSWNVSVDMLVLIYGWKVKCIAIIFPQVREYFVSHFYRLIF